MLQSWFLCLLVAKANAESLELRIDQISGLTKDVKGRTEYLMSVHSCSPICTLIGYESLAEKTAASVLSSDGIRGSFRLIVKLHRRTRPPPQKRTLIPVEVVEREGLLSDPSGGAIFDSGLQIFDSHSSFEPYGRVLLTGSSIGEKGNLNHNWRERDELIAEYIVDTTTSAVRRCRKSCSFHSDSSFVQKIVSNTTVDTPSFQLQLTAFPESSTERGSPSHLLLAAHFAEAAEKSMKQDLVLPFEFPGVTQRSGRNSHVSLVGSESHKCKKYRFVTSVGDDVAYVWYMSKDNGEDVPKRKYRLDTGSNQGATVIAFKNIEKSSIAYADTWGRNELSNVAFKDSSMYDHFQSFGKVHTGFHNRYNQVAEELRTWVRPGTNVLVTGAFVGGAMASLAYADWLSDKDMDIGLSFGVTFGAPQVGDKLFQKAFRELGRFEPSKASLGFFEQLVAADGKTGKVDLSTTMPSAIFDGLVPYPGIHSIDCLRSVLPIERLALSAPGHLRTFRSVGRRRYLYAGRRLTTRTEALAFHKSGTASNDTLQDLAKSVFMVHGNVMDHYIERLYSLYYDVQEMQYSRALRTVTRVQQLDHVKVSSETPECIHTTALQTTQALSVDIEVASKNDNMHLPKRIQMQVCEDCAKDAEPSCRHILLIGDASNTSGALVMPGQKTPMSFLSLRPLAKNTCVQFQSNKAHSPPTCATDLLPKESVRLASSPLIELKELLDCTKEQRCQMQFDGMTLLISSEMRNVFNESELVERAGVSRDGILLRGPSPLASSAAETQLRSSDDEAPMGTPGAQDPTSALWVEPPTQAPGVESASSTQVLKPALEPESGLSPTFAPMPPLSTSGVKAQTSAANRDIPPTNLILRPSPRSHPAQAPPPARKLGDLPGGLPVSASSFATSGHASDALSGKCESGTQCKCLSSTIRGCATPVAGQLGWCSVEPCERMRCSCDGTETCEKMETVVFDLVEAVRGGRYARCESRLASVALRADGRRS